MLGRGAVGEFDPRGVVSRSALREAQFTATTTIPTRSPHLIRPLAPDAGGLGPVPPVLAEHPDRIFEPIQSRLRPDEVTTWLAHRGATRSMPRTGPDQRWEVGTVGCEL